MEKLAKINGRFYLPTIDERGVDIIVGLDKDDISIMYSDIRISMSRKELMEALEYLGD